MNAPRPRIRTKPFASIRNRVRAHAVALIGEAPEGFTEESSTFLAELEEEFAEFQLDTIPEDADPFGPAQP